MGVLAAASIVGLALQPQKPRLAGDAGYQEDHPAYRPGGSNCEPASVERLKGAERLRRADACQEAAEQHRLQANDLIQQRRAANAAEASAAFAYQQTRIGAWGLALGFVTMFAAIAAAMYARDAAQEAKRAADETKRSADAFINAERAWLFVESSGTRASPDATTVNVEINGILRGRMAAEIIGIHWAQLSDTTFPGEDAFTRFENRATVWEAQPSYNSVGSITLPLDATFVGGWVSYRIGFPGERRSYFLFKLEKHGVDAAGWAQYVAPKQRGQGWPENT